MADPIRYPSVNNGRSYRQPILNLKVFLSRNIVKLYNRSLFIGITGSTGREFTLAACRKVLAQSYQTISTEPGVAVNLALPQTLLKLRPGIQKVVLDLGVSLPDQMLGYLELVKPATVIITRISYANNQYLGSLDQTVQEITPLIKQLPVKNGYLILNYDDLVTRKLAAETACQVIFFGTDPQRCDIWVDKVRVENLMTKFEVNLGAERIGVNLQLLGRHFIYPCLAAVALGVVNNISLYSIKKALESLEPLKHHLELYEGLDGWYVLDDSYGISVDSLEEAIMVTNDIPARRRILVLSEINDLGKYSEQCHRRIAQKIFKEKIDYVFLGTGETRFIGDELVKLGFRDDNLELNLSNSQMVTGVLKIARKGDIILVKGLKSCRLDEVVSRLIRQDKNK